MRQVLAVTYIDAGTVEEVVPHAIGGQHDATVALADDDDIMDAVREGDVLWQPDGLGAVAIKEAGLDHGGRPFLDMPDVYPVDGDFKSFFD